MQKVAQQHHQAFNDRSFYDTAAQLVTSDCVMYNAATGQTFQGVNGYINFGDGWLRMLPDAWIDPVSQEVDGNLVFTRFRGTGTFTGELVTPQSTIPGNGRNISMEFEEELEIADGKIRNGRLHFDMNEMMRQLGVAS